MVDVVFVGSVAVNGAERLRHRPNAHRRVDTVAVTRHRLTVVYRNSTEAAHGNRRMAPMVS